MSITIEGRAVSRISIVDDDRAVRQSYEMSVHELGVVPLNEAGPLGALETFASLVVDRADAALCDFKLKVKRYANFDGAALVARWYDSGFPALLCTKYDKASADEIRRYRAKIPVMLTPSDLDPERIIKGLEVCLREIGGTAAPSRRVWSTVVRVEDVDMDRSPSAYLVVPAWNPNESIRFLLTDIPDGVRDLFRPEARLLADVNLGAESYEDLFFRDWRMLP